MKKIKSVFSTILTLLVLVTFSTNLLAVEKKDSFEKTFAISPSGKLEISGNQSDIEILVWDKNEVKVTGSIACTGENEADLETIAREFKNIGELSSNSSLSLALNFIKSRTNMNPNLPKHRKFTIHLRNGDEVTTTSEKIEIESSYKIWIPESLAISIDSNYGTIKIADIKGNVNFNLYNSTLVMGNYGSSGEFDMKYGKGAIGSGGNTTLKLYSYELSAESMKNIELDSKYSKLNIKNAQKVTTKSYSDKYTFGQLNEINFNAKYSELHINSNIKLFTLDTYGSKIFSKEIDEVRSTSRYSIFNADNVSKVTITSSYSDKYNFKTVGTLKCNDLKYDEIQISSLTSSLEMPNTYSTNITINNIAPSFNKFYGYFKYGNIYLKLAPSTGINLKYHKTYGKVNGPTAWHYSKIERSKDRSITDFKGSTTIDAKIDIEFTSYSTDVTIE